MYKEKEVLNASFLIKTLITAVFFIYYTDYLAYSSLGLYISIAMSLLAIGMAFFDFRSSVLYSFVIIFMSARVPRDLVLVMTDLKITQDLVFNSIVASTIASFSLAQWIMISLGIIAFLKLFRNGLSIKLDKKIINLIILYFSVMLVMYISTIIDIMTDRDFFIIKEFLSDHKYFILSFCGIFSAIYYCKLQSDSVKKLISILIFIGIASGLRSIGFVILDMMTGNVRLSFAGQSYLLSAVFCAFLYTYARHYGVWKTIIISFIIFAGAFNISRLDILLLFIDFIILAYLFMYSNLPFQHKLRGATASIVMLILLIVIPPVILYNISSSAYHFLVYKMDFFTKEIWSGEFTQSPAVRLFEFKNILMDFVNSIYPLFIGRGFGSYFVDWQVPFTIPLGLFDYSKEQLISGCYYKPHTFFNYLFLKGGIIMIWLYVYMIWLEVKTAKNLLWQKNKDIIMLASFSIFFFPWAFNIFWRPSFIYFFSFILIVLISISNELELSKQELN